MSLQKKYILTALLNNIGDGIFRVRARSIIKKLIDWPVPGLNPPPTEAKTLIDELDAEYVHRGHLKLQQMQSTAKIASLRQ